MAAQTGVLQAAGIAAVLWDMDGTLVDTEPYWIDAEFELVAEHGGTWSHEDALNLVGNNLLDSGRYMAERTGIDLTPEVIVEELLDRVVVKVGRAVPWRPGAPELLADLRRQGVRCALVTMSYRRFVEPMLELLADDAFEVIVTGDAVTRGKPFPDPYLEAAAALGVAPEDTIAIEDSDTGARSAEAAGCRVLVVENHVPVDAGERRVFAPTLAGMTAQGLLDLVESTPPAGDR